MTDAEIDFAIAQECHLMTAGWVPSYNDPDNAGCAPEAEPMSGFTQSLDLMALAEPYLNDNFTTQNFEAARYVGYLENLVSPNVPQLGWSLALIRATPRQKAEAFLKAKRLWKD